jgi:hypothetical protein
LYNSSLIPKVVIKETFKNDIDIIKNKDMYCLYRQGKRENMLHYKTNKEVKELYSSYDLGYGKILKSGLGFGILPLWLSKKESVESIHIVEISQDVVDIFLENNELPYNITIEIGDIEQYKTEEKYDCILLDHYEASPNQWMFRSIKNISKNIPNHDLLWFWSIENSYLLECYNTEINRYEELFLKEQDFSDQWNIFREEKLKVETVPLLSKEKINEYVYTYADFLNSKYTKQS